MLHIWLLTAVSALYGIATGFVNAAAPQAALKLNLSSRELGFVGAGVPGGYALGCVLCGRLLDGVSGKRVLLSGAFCGALSLSIMAAARSSTVLVAAQILFGLASGAVWPFCSAWLLDFESARIVPKSRLLRHYNVSWTGGTAMGMLSGGFTCDRGWVFESFVIAAGSALAALMLTALAHAAPKHASEPPALADDGMAALGQETGRRDAGGTGAVRVTFAALLAAALFNFVAIGTKIVIAVNYAELNKTLGEDAARMGLFMATGLLCQLASFGASKWYEPWLGTRRVYFAGALALLAINAAFIFTAWLPLLLCAEALLGLVLAVAFHCTIAAFIARATSPRAGTTIFEATIGISGLAPLAAGALTNALKESGARTMLALQAPFYAGMILVAVTLVAQLVLIRKEREQRPTVQRN
ncbi:MAG TPA: MFS transporter [Planctomycetota bacterium]|nr:MFS transporter [Planctomycetota bacterium]